MRTVNDMIEASRKYQAVEPLLYDKSFAEIEKILRPDEDVLCVFTGFSVEQTNNARLMYACVALTNQRLLLGGIIQGWLKGRYTVQSFNIENINAIGQSSTLFSTNLTIDTLGDDIRINVFSKDDVNKIIADFDTTLHSIKANKRGVVVQQTSVADELKKFKDLLDAGILTQEEFDAKKKQLLGL